MAKKPRKRPNGHRSAAQRAASRANGAAGGRPRHPTPPDPAGAPRDELDSIRRQLARLDAAAEELYAPGRKISWRERNKELRAISRAMGPLVPRARLRRAELTVRGEAAAVSAPRKDPPTEPVPPGEAPAPRRDDG